MKLQQIVNDYAPSQAHHKKGVSTMLWFILFQVLHEVLFRLNWDWYLAVASRAYGFEEQRRTEFD